MRYTILSFILLFCVHPVLAQSPIQTIRGMVTDEVSGKVLSHASISLVHTSFGTFSDSVGSFILQNIPIGRYDIKISYVGYESMMLKEIQVSSAKELFLAVTLREHTGKLSGVVIQSKVNKEQALNSMAPVSARMLSVEEARRYAGGFDDPARLVSAFAGVNSTIGSNAISVRGNNPQSLQWKLEGVEISNPNHFADLAVFGGGGITALSSQLMTNSDFFTGAMPAEYQNALSGVFDLYMRNGNARKREHTFQLGLIGIDAASEGPFIQGKKASYLFNYRYATLGLLAPLLPENASGTQYQDLSFKLHFPTMKMGTLSVWGLGLIDHSNARSRSDVSEWKYRSDRENQDVNQYMGTAGITHKISIKSGQLLKTTVACNSNGIEMVTDRLDSNGSISHTSRVKNGYETITLSSVLNTRISHRHSNRSGILIQSVFYDLLQRNQPLQNSVSTTTIQQNGNSGLISAFSSSKIQWKDRIQGIAGFTISWFLLNHHVSLEPRGSVTYTLNKRQRISVGYGLHSRMERLNYYFIRDTQHQLVNRDLGFSKAHHWVAGYDFTPSDVTHFKLEFYLQSLFQVPVIDDSSFSLLNQQNDWFFGSALRNKGKGRNIGIDISFEKYLSKGYYYSGSLSLFSSRYQGGDGLWRSTRYNRNLALNMLIGKEWIFGRNKNKVMGLNLRCNVQGGEHYSPVDAVRSVSAEEVIFDESRAYSKQYAPSFSTHLTASYKVNKKNSSHELALKILNLNQYREYSGFRYNYVSQQVEVIREALFIPNLSYKIEF